MLSSYPRFCEIAVNLQWAEAACIYDGDLSSRYPKGCNIFAVRFAAGDVQAHLPERFVQALLMRNADGEGWEPDFWQIPVHERAQWLTECAPEFRREFLLTALRMQPLDADTLLQEIAAYSGNKPLPEPVLQLIRSGERIDLGGDDWYPVDHKVLTLTPDTLMITEYGVWD
jgi:hypothetical protein